MRSVLAAVAVCLLLVPTSLSSQLTEEQLRARIEAAATEKHVEALIQAADASRLLREYDQANELLAEAMMAIEATQMDALWSRISLELASGGGVNGAQRALREARQFREIQPLELAYWVNNFPILLVGGGFDEMVQRFSADAEDPNYQCACYDRKAWMHRVAGRPEIARVYWDSLVVSQEANPPQSEDPDARAQERGQLARNYARAGRMEDARRILAEAMAMPVSDEAMPAVRRRWAQAYAELGDVEQAVEHLEYLLSVPSLITVQTLETRLTWEPIRDHPAFRALLERHR
jgi:tetratricopeptide (TPR) repeat protein